MNEAQFNAFLSSLDQALDILERHRTPDPDSVAAWDALKQARALAVQAHAAARAPRHDHEEERLAA